jgi:GH25 family lysozyme M1 (1,4-beta-N-acetylmuramidase)
MLLDPNDVNTNPNISNSIPQYQDMFIFAELRAVRKERTVLVTSSETGNGSNILKTGLEKNIGEVNFIGVDQNKNSPNYLKFTTRYYDGSNGDNVQFEGFGMSNIKVIINSSFIPQVSIQFIDVRGMAFFNRENSPYRILFDFPPPIFYLSIKGYYGRALNYKLHLVKYTSEFKAENGNFVIDAQFVAVTFAPLTDVLFRYVVNFPLIATGNTSPSFAPDPNTPPRNTYELILKLKVLYDEVSKKINSLKETQKYGNTLNQIAKNTSTASILSDYKSKLGGDNGTPYLLLVDTSTESKSTVVSSSSLLNNAYIFDSKVQSNPINGSEVIAPTTFSDYNNIIKMAATPARPTNINKKLYIVFVAGKKSTVSLLQNASTPYTTTTTATNQLFDLALGGYTNELINSYNTIGISNGGIKIPPVYFSNPYDITTFTNGKQPTIYRGIDVTDLYVSLYDNQNLLNNTKSTLSTAINTVINQAIMMKLGMMPTIYNIFKIILDDVDTFFRVLNDTSNKAEIHHNTPEYNNLIISNNQYVDIKTTDKKIYSFPLVIDKQPVAGGNKEIRISPIKLSQPLTQPFPELTLIQEFIDTFNKQKKYNEVMNQKDALNDDGTYKWIPISPLDSKLGSDESESPYVGPFFGVDTNDGGTTMPINLSEDKKLSQILKIVLDRFYILSQSSYPTSFYSTKPGVSNAFINLYAKAEAANLANSVNQTNYAKNLSNAATTFSGDITKFYDYLNDPKSNMLDHYAFNNTENPSFPIANDGNIDAYIDKKNSNYVGSVIKKQNISIQSINPDSASKKPVDVFQNTKLQGFVKNMLFGQPVQKYYLFTNENLIYIADSLVENNAVVVSPDTEEQGTNITTRFLDSNAFGSVPNKTFINGKAISKNTIPQFIANGNKYFLSSNIGGFTKNTAESLTSFDNIINPWISQLSKHDDEISGTCINVLSSSYNPKLSALMFLSNYGYTLSPFNQYTNKLNSLLFNIAGVIQVPTYLPAYIGALVVALEESDSTFTTATIQNFFTTGAGKTLESSGLFIFADLHDIDKYLSDQDKKNYKDEFNSFIDQGGDYNNILVEVSDMYGKVRNDIIYNNITKPADIIAEKQKQYNYFLNPKAGEGTGSKYSTILSPLITRTNILNYSEISFTSGNTNAGYTSLQTLNADTVHTKIKDVNNSFFKTFFSELRDNINVKQDQLKQEAIENLKITGDEDIITQTYYSFKNINDKWLTNPDAKNKIGRGYPSNEDNKALIDSFVFVDRAMNPIGNTILNAEKLIEMFDDPNISVFSVLTQLLSLNGYEFFPLQNFMSYTQESWTDSFKIVPSINTKQNAAYVCMFIGGTSSYPTGVANGFIDDGITDLGTVPLIDFSTKPPLDKDGNLIDEISPNSEDGKQVSNNKKFPWGQVRAFRVRFGDQRQSMFTDIKIDSKEYPETNESIQILARLAGDNKLQSPVPKGQNLFSVYEQRAYKATITGLGNAMIQPTQYFQLENVPLFSGAYLILTVEHTIEGNKMVTSFSGTKILRYPVPRVLNPAAIMGFEGGDSDNTNPYAQGAGAATQLVGAITMSDTRLAQLNSVYGVDVSHWQENFNWKAAANSTDSDYPSIKFGIIKISQGKSGIDHLGNLHAKGAKDAGLKIGYYHYADQFLGGTDDEAINDAKAQAAHFISVVQGMPYKPDFPLMLDIENYDDKDKNIYIHWTPSKHTNNLWIDTFINELKNNKPSYNTIIYSGKPWLDDHTTGNFNNAPLWHSQYPQKPEQTDPAIASAWAKPNKREGWIAWQFSPSGKPNGYNKGVDISAMKKDFFDSPKLT